MPELQQNIFHRNPFIVKSEGVKRLTDLMIKSSGIALSMVGIKTFSLPLAIKNTLTVNTDPINNDFGISLFLKSPNFSQDAISLVMENKASLGLFLTGCAAHFAIKAVYGKSASTIKEMSYNGADSQLYSDIKDLEPYHFLDYRKKLTKAVYSEHIRKFLSDVTNGAKSTYKALKFSGDDIQLPYEKTPEYDSELTVELFTQESIHALHLSALLGKSKTSFAESFKDHELCDTPTIRAILENSDDLCEILSDNLPNLQKFMIEVESSLGQDAEFFLKDFNNPKGRTEFFDIGIEAIKNTAIKFQEYNTHLEYCAIVSMYFKSSKANTLTEEEHDEFIDKLASFCNLKNYRVRDNPLSDLVEKAKYLRETIGSMSFKHNSSKFHKVIKQLHFKNYNTKGISISQTVFDTTFSKHVTVPKDIDVETRSQVFLELEKRARLFFSEEVSFNTDCSLHVNEDNKKDILGSYRLDPLGKLKSSDAAKEATLKVQQRMMSKILNNECESNQP
jgi:hypothetical protein